MSRTVATSALVEDGISKPPNVADLLFSVFVHVADADHDVSPQDVRRFQSLLKDRRWSLSPDLSEAAAELAQDYSSRWTAYVEGPETADIGRLRQALVATEHALGPERATALRRSLGEFVDRLDRGSGFGGAEPEGRARARAEVRALLDGHASAVPTAPLTADTGALPAAASPVAIASTAADWPAAALVQNGEIWTGGSMRMHCIGVIEETHDTKTYSFQAKPRRMFHFKPGQFVTLELQLAGRTLRRSYTISSSPSRPYTLSITVKRVEKGWVSNWLFENMHVGAELDVLGAGGAFSCLDHPAPKLLFLSGGSGVTPVMSMLRWIADTGTPADVVFVNNVRTPHDIIFYQELLYLSSRMGAALKLAIVPARVPPGQVWNGMVGRFSPDMLRGLVPDFVEREVFVCGPGDYMAAVRQSLADLGHPTERYHQESFGGPVTSPPSKPKPQLLPRPSPDVTPLRSQTPPAAASPPASSSAPKTARAMIAGSNAAFPVASGQTILEAADSSGIRLEHSCRSGICGACRMRCTSGHVEMSEQSLLSADDIAAGYVLTCIGTCGYDVTLEA